MATPIKKEEGSRYYEIIIDNIRAMISRGELKCGEKIPSERELADYFNVSRVPVREALKIMEYMGVLDSSGGDGMYVRNIDINDLIKKLDFSFTATSDAIMDLMELRCSLEATAAYYAALRRTDEDLNKIQEGIDAIRQVKQMGQSGADVVNELRQLSHKFHGDIVAAAHNGVLRSVYENLFELLDISRQFTIGTSGISYDSILAHEAIFNKIIQQDCEGARTCMMEHLEATKERLVERLRVKDELVASLETV